MVNIAVIDSEYFLVVDDNGIIRNNDRALNSFGLFTMACMICFSERISTDFFSCLNSSSPFRMSCSTVVGNWFKSDFRCSSFRVAQGSDNFVSTFAFAVSPKLGEI